VPYDEAMHDIAAHGAEPGAGADHDVRRLQQVIAALAPMDRALVLLYLDERSHREIAEVLGIGESNVATKLSRLKGRIRDSFA
jgi:RNA polymerase sigma-70 factor (ECF subfamily)